MPKPNPIAIKDHASEYRLVCVSSFKGIYLSPPFPNLETLFAKRARIQKARQRRGLPPYTHIASFVPIR